jgi:phosphopantothenoylcysteine decarboxylase / phosphopantothenate---cysteine ligase
MGQALAEAALAAGHRVVVVSGPVDVKYPAAAELRQVISTDEMLAECLQVFPRCDGLIAVAAPCDYRPRSVATQKIRRTGGPLELRLVETADIVARLAALKTNQWLVAFALETEDRRMRAMQKLERKRCDMIVVNGPAAVHASSTRVEVIGKQGDVLAELSGTKRHVARDIFEIIVQRLVRRA